MELVEKFMLLCFSRKGFVDSSKMFTFLMIVSVCIGTFFKLFAGFSIKKYLNQSSFFELLCSISRQNENAVWLSFYEQKIPEVFLNKFFNPLSSSV